jgi:hypothetical protein
MKAMTMIDSVLDNVIADLRQRSKKSEYLNDPALWAKEVLGKTMWSKQKEIAKSIVDNTHTAVVSCNGAGKSGLAGMLAVWWVAVHEPKEVAVICSAPTYVQIARVLFTEMKNNFDLATKNGHQLPGQINQSQEWKLDDGFVMAWGRRPADKDLISSFQGIHRRYVMVILDEAGGIPEDLYTATEAVTNTEGARVLAIGNPDSRGTPFHRIFKEDPTWHKIKISAFDTHNFTNEEVPDELRPLLIQPAWVERQKISWGEDSARYKSKIMAEFPDEADNTFFSQNAIDKAIDTTFDEDLTQEAVLGVDLARFGEDESVVYINRGGRCRKLETWSKATAVESANRVHQLAREHGVTQVRVDATGLGGPVVDMLANMADNKYVVISMLGSAASPDKMRWLNARAHIYDELREAMSEGKIDLDPEDKSLLDEMLMIQYKFSAKGAIQIESKDDMRSRGVKSPDSLDALTYATANLSHIVNNKYGDKKAGDLVTYDYNSLDSEHPFYSNWVW